MYYFHCTVLYCVVDISRYIHVNSLYLRLLTCTRLYMISLLCGFHVKKKIFPPLKHTTDSLFQDREEGASDKTRKEKSVFIAKKRSSYIIIIIV